MQFQKGAPKRSSNAANKILRAGQMQNEQPAEFDHGRASKVSGQQAQFAELTANQYSSRWMLGRP